MGISYHYDPWDRDDVRRFCDMGIQGVSNRDCGRDLSRDQEDLLARIQSSIVRKRVLRLRYESGVYLPVEELDLCPLTLYYDPPEWYLLALGRRGPYVKPFKLSRVRRLQILDRCFVGNGRLDLADVLGRAWSTRPEGQLYHVQLRFLPKVADRVVDVQWHSTQKVTREPEGSAIVEFRVDGLNEITWWVLGYGDQVHILAPAALQDRVIQAAQNMIQLNTPLIS